MLVRNEFSKGLKWVKDVRLDKFAPDYSTPYGAMFNVDSINILNAIPSDSVDLVMTSPPFALTRKKEYGNEPIERYLDWFMPFCRQIHRILKPTGSFVLDIGGSWVPGAPVRSLYHFALAVKLAEVFHLAQEFSWYNSAQPRRVGHGATHPRQGCGEHGLVVQQ
jgi:SAM-dependent methyltransferase